MAGLFLITYIEHESTCIANQPFRVNSLPQGQEYLSRGTDGVVALLSGVTVSFFCASALNVNNAVPIPDAPVLLNRTLDNRC